MPDGWTIPTQSSYSYSEPIVVGGKISVMVGYVREKPGKNSIVLERVRGGSKFYFYSQEEWDGSKAAIEKLWPELAHSNTSGEIDAAITSALQDKKLLDVLAQYPNLLANAKEDVEILSMPPEHKVALAKFLETSGEIAMAAIDKLKDEPATDVAGLVKILEGYKLATCNSLVTTIKGKLGFIDTFEKLANDSATYERRGDDSIHSMIAKNSWIVDNDYVILHSDVTLNNVVYDFGGAKLEKAAGEKRPDFICLADGDEFEIRRLVIIEIKKPGIYINLAHVNQALFYKEIIEGHSGRPIKKCEIYLYGSGVSQKLLSTPLDMSGIHVRTYSDMVSKARKFYKQYYDIVQGSSGAF